MATPLKDLGVGDEFPLDRSITYLNHAAVAPWPRRASEAVSHFARENSHFGATHYERWLKHEAELRRQLAQLIGAASPHDIALQKNTSAGLSAIAYGLRWQPGDQIVITDQEFPSNRIVWESLRQKGVEVIEAKLALPAPEDAIIASLGAATKLLSISSVQYGTGLKLDLVKLGSACRQRKILFCVDAIQSLGAHPFDVNDCQADFVVADGHKWMLGPEGIAVFWVNPAVRDQLEIHEFGWHMIEHAGDYSRKDWSIARTARRFECGSPNMLGAIALSASLSLLLEIGLEEVQMAIEQRIHHLMAGLLRIDGIKMVTPSSPAQRAGILTFASVRVPTDTLFLRLKAENVICAPRGGGIRFSPHFYTPVDVLDRAVQAVERIST